MTPNQIGSGGFLSPQNRAAINEVTDYRYSRQVAQENGQFQQEAARFQAPQQQQRIL